MSSGKRFSDLGPIAVWGVLRLGACVEAVVGPSLEVRWWLHDHGRDAFRPGRGIEAMKLRSLLGWFGKHSAALSLQN